MCRISTLSNNCFIVKFLEGLLLYDVCLSHVYMFTVYVSHVHFETVERRDVVVEEKFRQISTVSFFQSGQHHD